MKNFSGLIDDNQAINLVLSGGAIKGVAHIALLSKLEELNIKIESISGTSVGALVGSLYASGISPNQILSFFKTTNLFKVSRMNPLRGGLLNASKFITDLKPLLVPSFKDLKIPISITAVDIEKAQLQYFSNGDLIMAVLASCAVPGIFSPVDIGGHLYVDGGIINNFPMEVFHNSELKTIGSYVLMPGEVRIKNQINSMFKIADQTTAIMQYQINKPKFSEVDLMLDFPLSHHGSFEFRSIDIIYEDALDFISNF